MRILFVSQDLYRGGTASVVSRQATYLAGQKDVELSILKLDDSPVAVPIPDSVKVLDAGASLVASFGTGRLGRWKRKVRRVMSMFTVLRKVRRTVRQDWDLVVCHGAVTTAIVTLASGRHHPPIVGVEHGLIDDTLREKSFVTRLVGLRLVRPLLMRADYLIAIAAGIQQTYLSLGYPASRIRLIPNWVPPTPPPMSRRSRAQSEPLKVCFLGRLTTQKGVRILVRALELLPQPDRFEIHILGEGPDGQLLDAFAVSHSSPPIRRAGWVPRPADVLPTFDVMVMPSLYEGMPLSILEGMQAGLAIIASDCRTGVRDILAPTYEGPSTTQCTYGEFGILIPGPMETEFEVTAQKLAEALVCLSETPDLLCRYQTQSLARSRDFSEATVGPHLLAALKDMIRSS